MSPSEFFTQTIINKLLSIKEAIIRTPGFKFILFLNKIGVLDYFS